LKLRTRVTALTVGMLGGMLFSVSASAEGQVLGTDRPGVIEDSYLVVLKDNVPAGQSLAERYGGRTTATWRHALHGFAAQMSPEQARLLAADPRVAFVEQNIEIQAADTQVNPPSWGLDRIDQRDLPLSGTYSYDTTAGNVHAYVIDSGIRVTHSTFGGRATWGANFIDTMDTDCTGHGTHVAGTVGGAQYGVAKGVALVAVKVLGCGNSGTSASVVSGVDWVTGNAIRPAVANMSLSIPGPGSDPAVDLAVRNSIQSGITYAVSAGNDFRRDACFGSPSKVAEAITVGATDIGDRAADFTNIGTCVDMFAPGVGITSAWHFGDTDVNTISGTSMAAPHVAGRAALYLTANAGASPATVQAALVAFATPDRVPDPGAGSPNLLLYTGTQIAVRVVNPGVQRNERGDLAHLQMTATGGTASYTWSATGLPIGVSINRSTGLITGTISSELLHIVTITATDTAGGSGRTTFEWHVRRDHCPHCR
jgi:subtilisin family serine protease